MFGKKRSAKQGNELRTRAASRQQFTYYNNAGRNRADNGGETAVDLSSKPSRLRWTPTIISIVVIVGCVLFSLTLSPNPGVETLNNEASPYRDPAEYGKAAEKILSGNLSSLTKLTINTKHVEQDLLKQFPELKAAVLRLPVLGRRPNLVVDIEPPAVLLTTPTKSYVLDAAGTAVSEVSALSSDARVGLLTVKDESGLNIEIGKYALPSDTVTFMTEVVAHLKAKNLSVSELTLPRSANQLDIRVEGLPYYIKTDVAGDARQQIGSFLAVKGNLEGKRITPAEYVDVRVEEKVFYK